MSSKLGYLGTLSGGQLHFIVYIDITILGGVDVSTAPGSTLGLGSHSFYPPPKSASTLFNVNLKTQKIRYSIILMTDGDWVINREKRNLINISYLFEETSKLLFYTLPYPAPPPKSSQKIHQLMVILTLFLTHPNQPNKLQLAISNTSGGNLP